MLLELNNNFAYLVARFKERTLQAPHALRSDFAYRPCTIAEHGMMPGYSHYNFLSLEEVRQIVGKVLRDPLTNAQASAAAAPAVPEKRTPDRGLELTHHGET